MPRILAVLAVLLFSGACAAPWPRIAAGPISEARARVFGPLRSLLGAWRGQEQGKPGVGTGERTYELILGGRYLLVRNVSRFRPRPGKRRGEVHQDWGIFAHERRRKTLVLRQFHIEGFVNRLVLQHPRKGARTLVFVSESAENARPGLRVRLTYHLEGPDLLRETFEIAPPGKGFRRILANRWTRVR